jgi:hypothetical protein
MEIGQLLIVVDEKLPSTTINIFDSIRYSTKLSLYVLLLQTKGMRGHDCSRSNSRLGSHKNDHLVSRLESDLQRVLLTRENVTATLERMILPLRVSLHNYEKVTLRDDYGP